MSAMIYGSSYAPAARYASTAPKLRITPRGRRALGLLVAVPIAIAAAAVGLGASGAAAGTHSGTASFSYVTVEPGDSLWQLARSVAPTADPREVIAQIENLNNLSSGQLQAGQQLAIPSQYATK